MFMFPIKSFIAVFYTIPLKYDYFKSVNIQELREAQHMQYGKSGFLDFSGSAEKSWDESN